MSSNGKMLIQRLSQLNNDERLKFQLHETFGGGFVVIELNPRFPAKGEKKYMLRWGDQPEVKDKPKLSFTSDKEKAVIGWVTDRLGELIQ